jgi:hypothetical protein
MWVGPACLGMAAGLFALGFYTNPVVLILLALFIPMAFVLMRAWAGVPTTLLGLVIFGALVWLMAGMRYAATATACTALIGLAAGYALKRRTTFYYSALASCAAMLGALGVLLLCVYLLWGGGLDGVLLDYLENGLRGSPELAKAYYYGMGLSQGGEIDFSALDLNAIMAIPAETAVEGVMRGVSPVVFLYLPQVCAGCVVLFGLLNYIIPRAQVKKLGGQVGPTPVFAMWQLPRHFGVWSLALLVISYVGTMVEWNNFDLVYSIVMGLLGVTYSIQGMALIEWLLKKRMQSRTGRAAIIAVTFLLLGVLNVYMWIGFFEQIAKIRKREWLAG